MHSTTFHIIWWYEAICSSWRIGGERTDVFSIEVFSIFFILNYEDDEDKNENKNNMNNAPRVRFEEDTIPEAEPKQNIETAGVTDETTGVDDEIVETAGVGN